MKPRIQPRALYLMPTWNTPSEYFMQRQIRVLEETGSLEAIVVGQTVDVKVSDGGSPIVGLTKNTDPRLRAHFLHAIRQRAGFPRPEGKSQRDVLAKLLRLTQANTILCQYGTFAVSLEPALSDSACRVFVHVHGYDTTEEMCPPGYRLELRKLSKFATIICNSFETKKRLINWEIPAEKLVVKYCGVEVPSVPTLRAAPAELTVLQIGRLVDCKSPDRTIEAFEIACERGFLGQLIIAGDGPLRLTCELLRVRSKWRDRITLLGAVTHSQVLNLLHSADIFTVHSIKGELTGQVEALGVSILEAMAQSLPVVSCRIGGIVETVVHEETGLLIHPGDVEGQAEAFLRLASDSVLRVKMGRRAWKRARDNFSIDRERAELLAIMNDERTVPRSRQASAPAILTG